MIKALRPFLLSLCLATASHLLAQDVSGDWQGSIGAGKDRLRLILHVAKNLDGAWKATVYTIDQSPDPISVTSFSEQNGQVIFAIDPLKLSYKGTVAPSGISIVGTLTQDGSGPFTFRRPTTSDKWPHDIHCNCSVSYVPVQEDVKLEVLDWGGTGQTLVLLAGLGETAHGFDHFAQGLAKHYHVYGITRRGFGESSSPPPTQANYAADRLGDDVLAVLAAKHLTRPVLVGHSLAGEELSSIGSRDPNTVAGLVYLDAAYEYAFYSPAKGDISLDAVTVRNELAAFVEHEGLDTKSLSSLLQQLPQLQKELEAQQARVAALAEPPADPHPEFGPGEAILLGQQEYTKVLCPVLAIYADPHDLGPTPEYTATQRAAMTSLMAEHTRKHKSEFTAGVPSAKVIVIPNASHDVYNSNEAEVIRDIEQFTATLPRLE